MNGKGSRPRNNHSEAFRANFEAIFGPFRPKTQAKASKPLKTQGNGLETHSGRQAKEGK